MLHQSLAAIEQQAAKAHIARRGVYRFGLRAGNSMMDMGPLAEAAGEELHQLIYEVLPDEQFRQQDSGRVAAGAQKTIAQQRIIGEGRDQYS